MLNVLRCQLTYKGQAETNAEAWFNIALRPRKPEGSLERTAQDGHLDSLTAPELCLGADFLKSISRAVPSPYGMPVQSTNRAYCRVTFRRSAPLGNAATT